MVSDFVKGRARFGFSGNIQKGITLHRSIDTYTDQHPATRKAREFFRPAYRLYSGAIVDILYDHYLANDVSAFPEGSLLPFTLDTYRHLDLHAQQLPAQFLQAYSYMKRDNWLYNYKYELGMERSLAGLVRRATYLTESQTAYNLFLLHYVPLKTCFEEFFEDVKQFAKEKFESLL